MCDKKIFTLISIYMDTGCTCFVFFGKNKELSEVGYIEKKWCDDEKYDSITCFSTTTSYTKWRSGFSTKKDDRKPVYQRTPGEIPVWKGKTAFLRNMKIKRLWVQNATTVTNVTS